MLEQNEALEEDIEQVATRYHDSYLQEIFAPPTSPPGSCPYIFISIFPLDCYIRKITKEAFYENPNMTPQDH